MKLKRRIFLLALVLVLVCGGCTQKLKKGSDEPSQTITGSADAPADVYEVQEEEE